MPGSSAQAVHNDTSEPPLMDTSGPAQPSRDLILTTSESNSASRFKRWRLAILAVSVAALSVPLSFLQPSKINIDPHDYAARTEHVLSTTPLIDGHNDLPYLIRVELQGKMYDGTLDLNDKLLGHTDIQRMRKGRMGGQFWSVYMDCEHAAGINDPSWVVRDTLEQIDITRRFIEEYPSVFQYCDNPRCAREAFKAGRIASMIGIEGGHQVGNSLGTIRQMYDLGARYITTTHNCDNAFGTAASTVAAGGEDKGLTPFGHEYVKEMNRLGMMIDLSHVSHQTMRDVLSVTQAPIIFSHSGAYAVEKHLRHAPDDVLRGIKKNGGIIMVVFVNSFLNMKHPEEATIHDVVDHVMHIVDVAGWEHVGIGADFSGTPATAVGLEDVSKYPALVEALMERGATDEQIRLFVGDNLLRVWASIEKYGKEVQAAGTKPNEGIWEERLEGWTIGAANSPFMFRSSREKTKESKRTAHKFDWGRRA